jgi:N-acetylglucosamine-6-phosphate deacetylase
MSLKLNNIFTKITPGLNPRSLKNTNSIMEKTLKIYNGKILTPYRIISGTVVVVDGKIKEVAEGNIDVPGAVEIDAKGNYIAPGFIDIHVHGGGGHDFMDGSEEAFLKIAETHAQYGTTGLMPTTFTSELDELYNTLRLIQTG